MATLFKNVLYWDFGGKPFLRSIQYQFEVSDEQGGALMLMFTYWEQMEAGDLITWTYVSSAGEKKGGNFSFLTDKNRNI